MVVKIRPRGARTEGGVGVGTQVIMLHTPLGLCWCFVPGDAWRLFLQLAVDWDLWLCSSRWMGLGAAASSGTADQWDLPLVPVGSIHQLFVLELNTCVESLPVLEAGKYGPCFSNIGNIWESWEYSCMGNIVHLRELHFGLSSCLNVFLLSLGCFR